MRLKVCALLAVRRGKAGVWSSPLQVEPSPSHSTKMAAAGARSKPLHTDELQQKLRPVMGALLKNGRHKVSGREPLWAPPLISLVGRGGGAGMRASARGTNRRRCPTEQVISPPAPSPGLGVSQRGLIGGIRSVCSPQYPLSRALSLILAVACTKAHFFAQACRPGSPSCIPVPSG